MRTLFFQTVYCVQFNINDVFGAAQGGLNMGASIGGALWKGSHDPVSEFIKNMGTADETIEKIGLGPLVRNTRSLNRTHEDLDSLFKRAEQIREFNEGARKIIFPIVEDSKNALQNELNGYLRTAAARAKEIRIMHDLQFPTRKMRKIYIVPKTSREEIEALMDSLKNVAAGGVLAGSGDAKKECKTAFNAHKAVERAGSLADHVSQTIDTISKMKDRDVLGTSTSLLAATKRQVDRILTKREQRKKHQYDHV